MASVSRPTSKSRLCNSERSVAILLARDCGRNAASTPSTIAITTRGRKTSFQEIRRHSEGGDALALTLNLTCETTVPCVQFHLHTQTHGSVQDPIRDFLEALIAGREEHHFVVGAGYVIAAGKQDDIKR